METHLPAVAELRARLRELTLRDEARLRRRLDRAVSRGGQAEPPVALTLSDIADEIARAAAAVERRRAAVPPVTYPAELPITARADELRATIADHRVVVVAGETGSGKTTQLPKMCLELGRGVRGAIAHTQPRRLAARTVADRIADELDVPLGAAVGYEVRFDRRVGDDTLLAVMTDGILLTAFQRDPLLRAYDTVIIDEAHERSLNIDFLLGYVHRLLPRRPDLKLIITSATIDPQRFAAHFDNAPVVEVSGRTYPVEVRYRPLDAPPPRDTDGTIRAPHGAGDAGQDGAAGPADPLDGDDADDEALDADRDQIQGIRDAVLELRAEPPGDILVFLSGEREIRDTADALADLGLADTEILPLYARLAASQQRRVFQPHRGRRIVLATNVAETSLTVPGIRYVIDAGFARISRFSTRLKVQRLPIEKISQASADQRKGRCGRVADGICIRLYSEDDFTARPAYTDPEILRTSLAAVLLQMADLGLGAIEDFPFLDPPDRRQVRDGLALLTELGALATDDDAPPSGRRRGRTGGRRGRTGDRRGTGRRRGGRHGGPVLTDVGRTLARLPIDPRYARMIIEADRNACLDEVLVITAALSIPDPRVRPADARATADAFHERFATDDSDFGVLLNLWRHLRAEQKARSSSQFRKLCHREYLHYLRVREWQDLYGQLRRSARDLGLRRTDTPGEPEAVHRSVLAGLLSHVGLKEGTTHTYRGARGARFAIQPGSVLFKREPQWIVAAELVETSRLWGRTVARIDPGWVEQLAGHLVVRSHSEPHWDADRGQVMAFEQVTLYGVPLVTGRRVGYGRVDPGHARELFIRHALVDGEWDTPLAFRAENERRLAQAGSLEDKLRRRDVVVDEDDLFDFYDAHVPDDVVSARHLERWWRQAGDPGLLVLPWELVLGAAPDVSARAYPDTWPAGTVDLPLTYHFEPGAAWDGVVVHVPLALLAQLRPEPFTWHVPGHRRALVTELLRTLPKDLRRALVPIPDTARELAGDLDPRHAGTALTTVLGHLVQRRIGRPVPTDAWDRAALPAHLRLWFVVTDDTGRRLGEGEDLARLQRTLGAAQQELLREASGLERRGLTAWDFGDLPQVYRGEQHGRTVTGYPTLVDEGDTVGIRVVASPAAQRRAMWAGTRRLLALHQGAPLARLDRRLDSATKLALTRNPHGGVAALLDDVRTAVLDELLRRHGGPVWTGTEFAALRRRVDADVDDGLLRTTRAVAGILPRAADVTARLDALSSPDTRAAVADLREQLAGLVHPGFVAAKTVRRLDDVERYLEAMQRRLEALPRAVGRDTVRMTRIHDVQRAYRDLVAALPPDRRTAPEVLAVSWSIQELRVSEFAQTLGTTERVSPERLLRRIEDLKVGG